MYSTHNEGKSVIIERFIRTLWAKNMIVNNSKHYLKYLDKLVNQYINIY